MKFLFGILIAFSFIYPIAPRLEANGLAYSQDNVEMVNFSKRPIRQIPKNNVVESNDFFLATFPKSGSHLIIKLLIMMTGKRLSLEEHWYTKTINDVKLAAAKAKRNNQFLFLHLGDKECEPFDEFCLQHPSYIKIVQIRDFRDSLVSLVHHFNKSSNKWKSLGVDENSSFDEKLIYLISENPIVNESPILDHAKNAVSWHNDPNAVVIRFEDIVGSSGGGDLEVQQQAISNLAYILGVELSLEKLNNITDNLFGTNSGPQVPKSNFRQGQIGSWKECFNEEHIRMFNEIWGDYQQALGYPLAN